MTIAGHWCLLALVTGGSQEDPPNDAYRSLPEGRLDLKLNLHGYLKHGLSIIILFI